MSKHTIPHAIGWIAVLCLGFFFLATGQDQGFDVIYEGIVDAPSGPPEAMIDLRLYGVGGFMAGGTFWGSAGVRAAVRVDGFALHADGSYGTDGVKVQAGAQTEIEGFGLAGDIGWTPGQTPIIDLRGWGALDVFRLTANVRLAGVNTSLVFGGTTDFGGFGVSANVGLAGGNLTQATVGANTELGAFILSGSAGLTSGQVSAGGGVGLQIGPVNLTGHVGYHGGIGLNAMVGGNLLLETVQFTAVGLYDNTGVGLEATGELALGTMTARFTGRFTSGGLSFEVGGDIPLGSLRASLSVALDDANGFNWAELRVELPL